MEDSVKERFKILKMILFPRFLRKKTWILFFVLLAGIGIYLYLREPVKPTTITTNFDRKLIALAWQMKGEIAEEEIKAGIEYMFDYSAG